MTSGSPFDIISLAIADVAHLVERHLAKVEVASSSLVIRSKKPTSFFGSGFSLTIIEIKRNKMQRRYLTEHIVNCRDLGGYPAGERVTAFGRAIRCGVINDPTEKDIEILKSIGIKTVIDLRGNEESENMPSVFASIPDFDYHHISLLETNPVFSKKCTDLCEMYILSLTEYSENYAAVLRLISTLTEPFLFHCFAGKDRTGLLAAMLLDAAGVCKEDILADYQVSFTYFKPAYERELASDSGVIWEKDPSKFYSDPSVMERILDYFEKEFGGIIGYFKKIGLTDGEIRRLSEVLFN